MERGRIEGYSPFLSVDPNQKSLGVDKRLSVFGSVEDLVAAGSQCACVEIQVPSGLDAIQLARFFEQVSLNTRDEALVHGYSVLHEENLTEPYRAVLRSNF